MMMNHKALAVFLFQLCCLWLISETRQVKYEPDWKSLDSRPLPSWYDQAKVGIFIHWGVFSVPSFGSEWFWNSWRSGKPGFAEFMEKNYRPDWTYADFARDFTAEFFDPIEWARIFERSGAKYVVLTSKHHEGFTLWPSKYSFNWNAKDVGPGRDLVGELATAIRQNSSLHFGLYHSLYEWYNPLYIKDKANGFTTKHFVETKIMPEMLELVNTYQPEIFWSDGDWEALDTYWNSKEFLAWLYNESPVKDQVVVNDRWGYGTMGKHGGFLTSQDRFNPGVLQKRKWEDCMTLDRQSWGFRREASLHDYLTTKELIATLVETISCGGNILINVGPTKYGKILPILEERLEELGFWLEINGEAIYKSKPWVKQNDSISSNVWYTQSDPTNIFAISLEYPPNGIVTLGSVPFDSVRKIELLGTDKIVEVTKNPNDSGTLVKFPDFPPNYGIHYAYTFKINLKKRIDW